VPTIGTVGCIRVHYVDESQLLLFQQVNATLAAY